MSNNLISLNNVLPLFNTHIVPSFNDSGVNHPKWLKNNLHCWYVSEGFSATGGKTGKNDFDNEKSAPSDECDVDREYNGLLDRLLKLLLSSRNVLFLTETTVSYQDCLDKNESY